MPEQFNINIPKANLLILDSDSSVRSAVTQALNLNGYKTTGVGSGQEALDKIKLFPFDLVLLDIYLPDINGIDFITVMHQQNIDIPVIVLTRHATLESAIACVKLGVVDYLLKPLEISQIINTVNHILHERSKEKSLQKLAYVLNETVDSLSVVEPNQIELVALTPQTERKIKVTPFSLDRETRTIVLDHNKRKTAELTKKETAILACLMLNVNRVISCKYLTCHALGSYVEEDTARNLVRPYISRLRRKMKHIYGEAQPILTVRESGYVFRPIE